MEDLEAQFQAAVSAVDIAGAVIVGSDAKSKPRNISLRSQIHASICSQVTGDFYYANAFGVRSLKDGDPATLLSLDSTFFYASSTKLLTSIAALQCVEKGQFTLDEDITRLIPEFRDMMILKGFDEESGEPIFVKSVKTITLRSVFSHC
jgi:CubicO group peptidase (beta-lactamase class C family)